MALTIGAQTRNSIGARYMTITQIAVDTSYPTGGWPLTPAQLGLPLGVDSVEAAYAGVSPAGGLNFQYDPVNQKLQAFGGAAAGAAQGEITGAVNLSTQSTRLQLVAIGR
jgi:hypothetical protein